MKICIYKGGLETVEKSGVGVTIHHQEKMLREMGADLTDDWRKADIIHFNTVFPDSFFTAVKAKAMGKKIVYYGHSTEEDFRNSFIGSNLTAPLFKKWIHLCYSQGDFIITPTPYSKMLLEGYGIKKNIYDLSNGVDVDIFHRDEEAGKRFRKRFGLSEDQKVVICVGLLIERKGILDFISLARRMPDVRFIWFGGGNEAFIPRKIKNAIKNKPSNLLFPGFIEQSKLREAYCGADAFVFLSKEETEGIVILEAFACEIPTVLREIPVYDGWIEPGVHAEEVRTVSQAQGALRKIFATGVPERRRAERKLAEQRSYRVLGSRLMEIYHEEHFI